MIKIYHRFLTTFTCCFFSILLVSQISRTVTINSVGVTTGTIYQRFTAPEAQHKANDVSGTLVVNDVSKSGPFMPVRINRFFLSTGSGTCHTGYAQNLSAATSYMHWLVGGYDPQSTNFTSNPNFIIASEWGIGAQFAPYSSFSVSSVTLCAGSTLSFTDTSNQFPSSWSWTVSPGVGVTINSPGSQNPQITFSLAGMYSVTLVASNTVGIGSTYIQTITVSAPPVVSISTSPDMGCVGTTASLTASGAVSYTWNPGTLAGNQITVSPSVSTIYTVLASDINGCVTEKSVLVQRAACTDLRESTVLNSQYWVVPHPISDKFRIITTNQHAQAFEALLIFDALGRELMRTEANLLGGHLVDISSFPPGIYVLKAFMEEGTVVQKKIVKE